MKCDNCATTVDDDDVRCQACDALVECSGGCGEYKKWCECKSDAQQLNEENPKGL